MPRGSVGGGGRPTNAPGQRRWRRETGTRACATPPSPGRGTHRSGPHSPQQPPAAARAGAAARARGQLQPRACARGSRTCRWAPQRCRKPRPAPLGAVLWAMGGTGGSKLTRWDVPHGVGGGARAEWLLRRPLPPEVAHHPLSATLSALGGEGRYLPRWRGPKRGTAGATRGYKTKSQKSAQCRMMVMWGVGGGGGVEGGGGGGGNT